mgnify:CR=1 FL=1
MIGLQQGLNLTQNGAYQVADITGALSTIAAGTATAGHLFGFRWAHATKSCVILKLSASLFTTTAFTTGQEVGLSAFIARGYTANHTGGAQINFNASSGNVGKLNTDYQTSNMGNSQAILASTVALTSGTHTLDATPFAHAAAFEAPTAAAVARTPLVLRCLDGMFLEHPLILRQDEGIVIRNAVLMGAGGVAKLVVQMQFAESDLI